MTFAFPAGFPRPFGPYLLLSSFGRGGMGEVFLAKRHREVAGGDLCVLKTLRRDLGQDASYVRRFLDEARVVVLLAHENICPVYDVGRVGSDYFIAMEHIAGANVRDVLVRVVSQRRPLPKPVALYIASETLRALSYAHRMTHPLSGEPLGLVHRDISPHNVMIGFDGDVKLIDFGLAESILKQEQTESHIVMGKVGYMSPEQACGDDVDARCDQFAAAVMLFEMLAHDRYYGDLGTPQIWQIVGQGGFVPRSWGRLDGELQRICARALAAASAQRYPSCEELAAELDRYRAKHGLVAGADDLRALMQEHFAKEVAEVRDMRAACAHLRAPEGESASSLLVERDDETRSVRLLDDGGRETRVPLAPVAPAIAGRRAPVVVERPRSRALPALAAAAFALAVIAGLALLVVRQGARHDEGPPPPVPVVELASAPSPPAAPVVEPAPAPAPRAVVAEAAPPTRAAPVVDEPAARRPKGRSKQRPVPTTSGAAPASSPLEVKPPAEPPPAPPVEQRKRTLAESIAVLERCRKPCVTETLSKARAQTEESFKSALKRVAIDYCVAACTSGS